jgi:hypothetical protein
VVPVTALWLPILVSAVLVFVASSLIHMVLQFHRNDWKKVPDEDGVMDALRRHNLSPGDYCVPRVNSPNDMKDPAFIAKFKRGPVVFMTVLPGGDMAMGAQLAQWFVFSLVVSLFAGYLAGAALGPGADYVAQEHGRRADLRPAHGRGLRVAVAVRSRPRGPGPRAAAKPVLGGCATSTPPSRAPAAAG